MYSKFQAVNPFREPSWRFQRVLDLLDRDRPGRCTRHDDEYIRSYRRLAGRLRRGNSGPEQMALFQDCPGLFLAHLFHHQPDKEWRWLLQARILTGESDRHTAKRMATIPEAVKWYERIFFHVRDRLDAKDYITKMVIGRPEDRRTEARDGGISDFQEQINLKLVGYFGGPIMLDLMFIGHLNKDHVYKPGQAGAWCNDLFTHLLSKKATTAIRHLEVNKYNVIQLMELQLRVIEAAKEAEGSITDLERNVGTMLESVPWELAEARDKRQTRQLEGEVADKFVISAVEPRVDEMVQFSMGRVPKKLIEDCRLRILPVASQESNNAQRQAVQ